jgi:hypothetical protein
MKDKQVNLDEIYTLVTHWWSGGMPCAGERQVERV